MKRSVVIILILLVSVYVVAQPPKPNHRSKNNAEVKDGEVQTKSGPLGTSTTLLITMGVLATGYKIKKNKNINKI